MIVAAAAHSPIVTALLLLSFLFFLFFLPLGVLFLTLAMLAWMVLAVPTFQALAPNASQGRFWACAIAGVLAALLIGGWAAYTLGSMPVEHAAYRIDGKTYTVKDLRNQLSTLVKLYGSGLF